MLKKSDGYITVETTLTFTLFVLLVISILSLIGIVTVQARVHYALTQTANELSMYSYLIDTIGLSEDIKKLDQTGTEVQEKIDKVLNDLETIENSPETIADSGSAAELFKNLKVLTDALGELSSTVQEVMDNPKKTFVNIVRWGLNGAKNWGMQKFVIRPMLEKYLKNGTQDADVYLKACGVINGINGIDLSDSVFIDSDGNITITASYKIDYTFGLLPIPFTDKVISVTQTAKTSAWLGGKSG